MSYTRKRSASQAPSRGVGRLLVLLVAATSAGCGSGGTDAGQSAGDDPGVALADVEDLGAELTAELERAELESVASAIAEIELTSLIDDQEFTLLAPTDDAFLEATADELADLLADPDALLALLLNHVLPTTLRSDDLTSISTVRTRAGHELDVTSSNDGTLGIGGARVVTADVTVGDGVIHTIDRLLIPGDDR